MKVETDLQEVPPILGSRCDVRDVLTNLVFNAVDAMPKGGTITIRTRADGDHVLLEVRDSGIGMPESVRERCLEPFFSTKGGQGTGLGLALVRETVRRHHGLLDLRSAPGEGTTVSIRFPATGWVGGSESESAPEEDVDGPPPLRILVVDDEPLVRRMLTEYLTLDGHSVETATNGRHALDKFRAGRYDLVIADRAMPEMNGDQLASAIRQLAFDEPFIMLTGFADLMQASAERPLGVDLVLGKPLTRAALRRAVAEVAPAELREAQKSAWERGPGKTVLIVDDDHWIRDLLQMALEAEGYEVAVAEDGLEALDRITALRPAVIVLDMMMPRMDGGRFAEELRRRGIRDRVPLLVITADAQGRYRAKNLGADAYLAKPFALPELLDEVARLATAPSQVA